MKRLMILASVAAVVGLAACGGKAGAKNAYGKPIPAEMPTTPAGDILSRPQDFDGKDVLVSGKITSECPSGGWIWVKDPTGEIYVNMHPTNVFIPQKVGTTVKTMGRVVLEQGRPQVVGRGLQF